ncbi:MAG: hypothetical protein ABIQ12_02230 [Opitutaceae bacterium]
MNHSPEVTPFESPEQLVRHISQLMDEAEAMLVGPVSGYSTERIGAIRFQLEAVEAQLKAFYGRARQHVVKGVNLADEAICAHPYRAVAVALSVGLLIGACAMRRSGD